MRGIAGRVPRGPRGGERRCVAVGRGRAAATLGARAAARRAARGARGARAGSATDRHPRGAARRIDADPAAGREAGAAAAETDRARRGARGVGRGRGAGDRGARGRRPARAQGPRGDAVRARCRRCRGRRRPVRGDGVGRWLRRPAVGAAAVRRERGHPRRRAGGDGVVRRPARPPCSTRARLGCVERTACRSGGPFLRVADR